MSRRKFTSKFKTKVVLDALKESNSLKDLALKYELIPSQISTWKTEFLNQAEGVFDKRIKSAKTQAEEEREMMLKTIGELKMENDFLKKVLPRSR